MYMYINIIAWPTVPGKVILDTLLLMYIHVHYSLTYQGRWVLAAAHTCTCIYVHGTYMYIRTYTCMYMCVYTYMYLHVHVYYSSIRLAPHEPLGMFTYCYMYRCVYMYIIHIYMYIHYDTLHCMYSCTCTCIHVLYCWASNCECVYVHCTWPVYTCVCVIITCIHLYTCICSCQADPATPTCTSYTVYYVLYCILCVIVYQEPIERNNWPVLHVHVAGCAGSMSPDFQVITSLLASSHIVHTHYTYMYMYMYMHICVSVYMYMYTCMYVSYMYLMGLTCTCICVHSDNSRVCGLGVLVPTLCVVCVVEMCSNMSVHIVYTL